MGLKGIDLLSENERAAATKHGLTNSVSNGPRGIAAASR
jgi:hypothetical protein